MILSLHGNERAGRFDLADTLVEPGRTFANRLDARFLVVAWLVDEAGLSEVALDEGIEVAGVVGAALEAEVGCVLEEFLRATHLERAVILVQLG